MKYYLEQQVWSDKNAGAKLQMISNRCLKV